MVIYVCNKAVKFNVISPVRYLAAKAGIHDMSIDFDDIWKAQKK